MGSLLVRNGYVVTVDRERRVFPNGYVAIEDDRIAAIGPMSEAPPTADQTIDADGMLVMPGLINCHNHHWGSLFKNTGEGLLLEPWLDQVTIPLMKQLTPAAMRMASYLGALEMIRTGTTCSLNHIVSTTDHEIMTAIIEPVLEVGIRQLVTKEIRETPAPPFSTKYPAVPHVRSLDEELVLAEEIIEKWDGAGGLVKMGLAVETGANWMLHNATSDRAILEGVALAQHRNLRITNHCSAGTHWLSIKEFEEQTGGGDVDYLARLGALTDDWTLIHCLWLKDNEIKLMAEAGATPVTCPVSNAYSCDGIAPLKQMFNKGIRVALGSDGAYVNCSIDMVEQMKFAALIQNIKHYDPALMTAERVIEMATINGAKAVGMEDAIGSLEVRKKADIAIFNLNKAHATVGNRPIAALVFSAHGTDVDTVIINGKVVLRGGDLAFGREREKEVLIESTAVATDIIKKAGLADRVFVHWRK